jgi:hypothetical protein
MMLGRGDTHMNEVDKSCAQKAAEEVASSLNCLLELQWKALKLPDDKKKVAASQGLLAFYISMAEAHIPMIAGQVDEALKLRAQAETKYIEMRNELELPC